MQPNPNLAALMEELLTLKQRMAEIEGHLLAADSGAAPAPRPGTPPAGGPQEQAPPDPAATTAPCEGDGAEVLVRRTSNADLPPGGGRVKGGCGRAEAVHRRQHAGLHDPRCGASAMQLPPLGLDNANALNPNAQACTCISLREECLYGPSSSAHPTH